MPVAGWMPKASVEVSILPIFGHQVPPPDTKSLLCSSGDRLLHKCIRQNLCQNFSPSSRREAMPDAHEALRLFAVCLAKHDLLESCRKCAVSMTAGELLPLSSFQVAKSILMFSPPRSIGRARLNRAPICFSSRHFSTTSIHCKTDSSSLLGHTTSKSRPKWVEIAVRTFAIAG